MIRDQGIKRLKEVLSSLPKDTSQWPPSTMVISECGCILQQAASDECIIQSIAGTPYKTVLPFNLSQILGLSYKEGCEISVGYDGLHKEFLTRLIGELV